MRQRGNVIDGQFFGKERLSRFLVAVNIARHQLLVILEKKLTTRNCSLYFY